MGCWQRSEGFPVRPRPAWRRGVWWWTSPSLPGACSAEGRAWKTSPLRTSPQLKQIIITCEPLVTFWNPFEIFETDKNYSMVPNVTHRSIETHACTLGESIGLNYPHAWTNGKLLCGKKHTTNNFVSHNPIKTHDFKISSCQKCDFQLNHTTDLHF